MNKGFKGILAFIAVSFGLAYLLDYTILVPVLKSAMIREQAITSQLLFQIFASIRMYTPFIGVVAALKVMGYSLKKGLVAYGLRGGKAEYIIPAIAIPYTIYGLSIIYALVVGYGIVNPVEQIKQLPILQGKHLPFSNEVFLALIVVSAIINGSTIATLLALGEEMGWRGFLLREIGEKTGLYPATIIIGIIWSLWHAPLILAGYNYPHHPDIVGLGMFTLICIVWSIVLSQLRVLGRSVIPPAVMHGNINAIGPTILLSFTVGDELYTSPVGIIGLIASATIALILSVHVRGSKAKIELYDTVEEVFSNVEY